MMSKKRSAPPAESKANSKPNKIKKTEPTASKPIKKLAKDNHQSKSHLQKAPSPVEPTPQTDFPRGGGISLTSYQQAEAKRDGVQQAEQLVNSLKTSKPKTHPPKRSLSESKSNPKKAKTNETDDHLTESYRIEHLNSKRLIPGIKLAGLIIQIRPLALIVALPSHLIAHVPISEISSYYTKRLEETAEEDEEGSQNSSQQSESSLKGLDQIFSVGQWIRCSVLKTTPDGSKNDPRLSTLVRSAMKVTLTLDPAHVNSGIDKSNLCSGLTLTGAVKSIEDRGYVIDLGIPNDSTISSVTPQPSSNNLTAFVAFTEATQATGMNHTQLSSSQWEIGQIIWCRINKLSENGATCVVSVNHRDLCRSMLTEAPNIDSILPLHMVSCQVTSIIPSRGLNVNFLGYFKGSIDFSHLGLDGINEQDLNEKFTIGQKLRARVLWDTIPSKNNTSGDDHGMMLGPKIFSLTLLEHVIKQDIPGIPSRLCNNHNVSPTNHDRINQIVQYPVGYIFQIVKVYRVEEEWGLYVTCINQEDGHPIDETSASKLPIGFVHIAAIADSFVPSLPQDSGSYKIGSTHKARVTGISPIDGLLQLSLQPSVIEQAFLRPEDIPIGTIIDVRVKELTSSLLVVKIHDGVDGIVWPDHYSDVKLRQPEKRFTPDAKLKARVLYTNLEKNQVVLTLRKALLKPETEIITSYESARVGLITYGFVRTVKEKSMIISFFGRTKGLVPIGEADAKFVESMEDMFTPGKLVQVRITDVNIKQRKILASLRLAISEKTPLEDGDQVSALVTGIGPNHVKLNLHRLGAETSDGPTKGLISLATLASKRRISPDDLKAQLKKGDTITDLIVTGKDEDKNLLIVGFAKNKKPTPKTDLMPLEVGDQVTGTIKFIHQKTLVLHLRKDDQKSTTEAVVEGFISIDLLAKQRKVSPEKLKDQLSIGQEIPGLQLTYKNEERGLLFVGFPDLPSAESSLALDLDSSKPMVLSSLDHVVGRICDIKHKQLELLLRKEGTEGYADEKGIISIEKVAHHQQISQEEVRSSLTRGDYIYNLVVRKKIENNGLYLLTFSSSQDNSVPPLATSFKPLLLSVGDLVVGTVQAIHEKNIMFSLKREGCKGDEGDTSARGIMLSKVLAGHWHVDLKHLKDKLEEGQEIRKLVVHKIDPSKDLVIVGFASPSTHLPMSLKEIKNGMALNVRIIGTNSQGLKTIPTEISPANWTFSIDFPDINDDYDQKISLQKGSEVKAIVVRVDNPSATIYLSTRQSDLNGSGTPSTTCLIKDHPIRSLKLSQENVVRGFVQKLSSKVGLILQVGTGIRGTVHHSKLPADWNTKFKIRQVVSAKITSVSPNRFFIMTLTEGFTPKTWEKLQVGQTFMVHVSQVQSYGLTLTVPKTKIRGLCHVSQIYDNEENFRKRFQDQQKKVFKEGMELKASILSIENQKLGFTIKPSVVNAQPDSQIVDPEALGLVEELVKEMGESKQEGLDESSDEEMSEQQKPSCSEQKNKMDQPTMIDIDFTEPSLPISSGFAWNPNDSKSNQPDGAAILDEELTDTKDISLKKSSGPPHSNGHRMEEKSVEELEKLLLEAPNSSKLWIQLISVYVQKGDIPQARATAKRALDAIHYREEKEKWNVWICLLKLENTHGTTEQFSKTFSEASVYNDSKTVWLKVAQIYANSGNLEKADETYAQALKKFRQSSKVWSLYGAFCLKKNQPDQATDLLSRSLKSLPPRKHIKTITKFAESEFKLGDPERGRTIFEGLVGTYPNRTNLWSIYIQLEIKSGTTAEHIRGLFVRMMGMKFNPKKTKATLKKWYDFEQTHGDKESQSMVLERAQTYVSSLMKSSSGSQALDGADD